MTEDQLEQKTLAKLRLKDEDLPNALNISLSPAPSPEMEVLIDLWLDQSSASDRDPIGIKGEPSYRYFWSTLGSPRFQCNK